MNNLSKEYSHTFIILITILSFSLSSKSIAANLNNVKSPDFTVRTINRCIPTDECFAFNIKLNATVDACSNPYSLNWQYIVKNYKTGDIIQYSYNYQPVPDSGKKGNNNLDNLEHTMNAELTILDSLPVGEYYVEWTVFDSLRNAHPGTQYFRIYDTEPPVIDINHYEIINGFNLVEAISFDKGYASNSLATYDNCKAAEELYFTFSPVLPKLDDTPEQWAKQFNKYGTYYYDANTGNISTQTAFLNGTAYGWNNELKSSFTSKAALCETIFNQGPPYNVPHYLKIYVWDDYDNQEFCDWNSYSVDSVLLNLYCEIETPASFVEGQIVTLNNMPAENMIVAVDDSEYKKTFLTDTQGYYTVTSFGFNEETDFEIYSYKNSDYKKGISTLDILLIRRYILGLLQFDSPFKTIAADVNGDKKVSANDMLQLVNLLLGKKDKFNNYSYIGILKDYEFKNPNKAYKETSSASKRTCHKNNESPLNIDFWAIKIGDVNESSLTVRNRDYPVKSLYIDDIMLNSNEGIRKIPVYIDNIDYIQGFQLAFDLLGLEILGIESNKMNISENDYNIKEGKLLLSLDVGIKGQVNAEDQEPLFVLNVKPEVSGKLSEMISLDNQALKGEIYFGNNFETNNLSLEFRNANHKFELFQNYPNPFTNQTTISFNLDNAKKYKLEIYDLQGNIIKTFSGTGKKGLNKVLLSKDIHTDLKIDNDLNKTGIYIYRLIAGEDIATRKMVIIQ